MRTSFDIAIVGSGFAGSLMAMVAKRLGFSVVLLERGRHPRFAIGESSTPLANLLLEELASEFDLPRLLPLAKWGSWQRAYPRLACGLKRGFTFYHHRAGQRVEPRGDHANQLLVAASPNDHIADTHWYRAEFDHFLIQEARAIGVDYLDEADLQPIDLESDPVHIGGTRHGESFNLTARLLIDATGPGGFAMVGSPLRSNPSDGIKTVRTAEPATRSLYSHFRNVGDCESLMRRGSDEAPTYPPDHAAVHHVFEGGWVWSLRFNNGITSAGVMATESLAAELNLAEGEPSWRRLLARFPTLGEIFEKAAPVRSFTYAATVSFRAPRIVGPNWLLLPSAAGFVDPLLSTGFPLALLGIQRVAAMLKNDWGSDRWVGGLRAYAAQTSAELDATTRLIDALYRSMGDFPRFISLSLLYFAAASYSEVARRLHRHDLATGFLLHDHPTFGAAMRRCCEMAGTADAHLADAVRGAIEPIDIAGLNRTDRNRWYPVDPQDTLAAAHKLGATAGDIQAMFRRCGV